MELIEFMQTTGASYEDVAAICCVDSVTVRRWMCGMRKPHPMVNQLLLTWFQLHHVNQ